MLHDPISHPKPTCFIELIGVTKVTNFHPIQ